MPIQEVKRMWRSIGYAWRGLRYIFLHEHNFRIQVYVSVALLFLIFLLPLTRAEIIVLLVLAVFVMITEIINSAMEAFIDVMKPRLSYHAQVVKDMLAAMVLLAALVSCAVGLIILVPAVFELVHK